MSKAIKGLKIKTTKLFKLSNKTPKCTAPDKLSIVAQMVLSHRPKLKYHKIKIAKLISNE